MCRTPGEGGGGWEMKQKRGEMAIGADTGGRGGLSEETAPAERQRMSGEEDEEMGGDSSALC